MPDPASADFIGTGRFGFNNPAANRRELINGGDLLKDRSVPPKKLAREAFPPDIRPGPSGEKPSFHDEPSKDAHEKGVPRSVGDPARFDRVARDDHNHDFTYQRVGMVRVKAAADADYTAPFFDADEGIHPNALPTEAHKRIANWLVYPDYADRIKGGPVEVWTETSLDGGTTYEEPVLRAIAPPGAVSAEYEVREVDWDPTTYAVAPQVRVYVKPVGHDRGPILKVPRAGIDGKLDPDWLPEATTRKPLVLAAGAPGTGGNTVANTAAQTDFASEYVIPANRLVAGGLIRVRARGLLGTDAAGATLTFVLVLDAVNVITITGITFAAGTTNAGWTLEFDAVVNSIGATASLEIHGEARVATAVERVTFGTPSVGTVDSTQALDLNVAVGWGSADPQNTITLHQLIVEILDLDT